MWLSDHLEKFVRPTLGYIPDKNSFPIFFTSAEMAAIKSAWKSVKDSFKHSKCDVLVLPGRDVFIFEILAQREKFPTLFIPSCSRMTSIKLTVPKNSFVVDTGFLGTIPRNLNVCSYKLLSYRHNNQIKNIQIFSHLTGSRYLALKIESTPKYWKCGKMMDEVMVQELSNISEFKRAAVLTMQVYCDSSPAFIYSRSTLKKEIRPLWI